MKRVLAVMIWWLVCVSCGMFFAGCERMIVPWQGASDAAADARDGQSSERFVLRDEEGLTFQDSSTSDVVSPFPLDANVPTSDAALFRDAEAAPRDTATLSDRVATDRPSSFGFEASVLAPTTCHGRTLRLPDSFRQRGLTAWHLCYVTPDPRDRGDAGEMAVRPASVRFEVGRDTGFELEPVVSVLAPRTANPWTASVALALPDTILVPRFNVRQELPLPSTGFLWALDTDGAGGLRSRGLLRAWRVGPDGQQTEVTLEQRFAACGGLVGPTGFPSGNYVPQGMCPAAIMSCPPHRYHCQP